MYTYMNIHVYCIYTVLTLPNVGGPWPPWFLRLCDNMIYYCHLFSDNVGKIVYIDEEPISSKDNETLSKDEEEIHEIMCLLRDPSFYSKCEEYNPQFANDIASSSIYLLKKHYINKD